MGVSLPIGDRARLYDPLSRDRRAAAGVAARGDDPSRGKEMVDPAW